MPSVAVVGAGRLGTALALALAEGGYEVAALVSHSAASARRAAKLAGVTALTLSLKQLERLPSTDLLFITTPDDAIAETARLLSETATLSGSKATRAAARTKRAGAPSGIARPPVALHASGALSAETLAPLRRQGFAVGSMHPLVSVSDAAAAGAHVLRGAFYGVEGDAAATRAARRIVRDLGGQSFSIKARDKALYHAAAVMTAGHTVALFDTAARLLMRCGLAEQRAREILLPLLRSSLDNLSTRPPARALTGPFARADVATVEKHLAALTDAKEQEALAVYRLLGRLSLRLAGTQTDATARREIERALEEHS